MLRKWIVLLALLVLVALPTAGQRSEVYFSLTTTKTFVPGEKIGVRVYARGVQALEFRVYRVNDPIQFFERLGDVHNFGERGLGKREQVETLTLLERFHDWKLSTWFQIRDLFRAQYSARSRSMIRVAAAPRRSAPVDTTIFAQVPLLNESQLVARWRQDTPSNYLSESEAVPVNGLANGAYVVEATDGTLRAYTVVIVSDIGLITKSAPGQIVAFVADRHSGAPIVGAEVHVWEEKQDPHKLETDANGLAVASLPQNRVEGAARVIAVRGADVALTTPYAFSLSTDTRSEWTGYVYTDRPVYRPGHTVHFRAVLRAWSGEKYAVPQGQQVQVQIDDPTNKRVLDVKLPVSQFGTVHGDFTLAADAALGYYGVSLDSGGARQYSVAGGFHVEEYKKPEYEVQVQIAKPHVLEGSSIDAIIQARYYFGEPVAGAQVKYVVHTSPYWSPFIEREDDEDQIGTGAGESEEGSVEGYQADDQEYAGEQVSEQSGMLDANGILSIHIPTRVDEHHQDVRYRIEARVTDEGNREISGVGSVAAAYGSFAVGVTADSYVYQIGQNLRASAVARNYDGHPVATPIHLEIARSHYDGAKQVLTVLDSKNVQTGADGQGGATFSLSIRRIHGPRLSGHPRRP